MPGQLTPDFQKVRAWRVLQIGVQGVTGTLFRPLLVLVRLIFVVFGVLPAQVDW